MKKSAVFVLTLFAALSLASVALAAEGEAGASSGNSLIALGAAIAIGVAAFGCGIGQGNAVRGALEGLARNPGAGGKILTYMIIGLAFIESLAIYGLVVALMLFGKLG